MSQSSKEQQIEPSTRSTPDAPPLPAPIASSTIPTVPLNPRLVPRVKRNLEKAPLIPFNTNFRGRWMIKGIIGQGGYGEIYLAQDNKTNEDVAIKVEPRIRRGKVARRMMLEQRVLLALRAKPHSPYILGSGHEKKINFIVLQMLSVNLGDLKKQSPVSRLSRSTVGRVMVQSLAALRDIHQIGYVHRDVKPGNICFGVTPNSQHRLVLFDFGLVRRYLNEDGTLRAQRPHVGFRGTLRYVSLRIHNRLESAPIDDLLSLMYTGLELLLVHLPWRGKTSQKDIRNAKEQLISTDFSAVSDIAGEIFCDFARSLSVLQSDDEPDYAILQKILYDMYSPKRLTDPYDWDNEFRDVEYEQHFGIRREESKKESLPLTNN